MAGVRRWEMEEVREVAGGAGIRRLFQASVCHPR